MKREDLRCLCGSLVAKVTTTGIEVKCRRCKRVALIPLLKKEQKVLEEEHPGIFRYEITFDHPHPLEASPHQADPKMAGGDEEGPLFGRIGS
jgi:phage FluMu protein Com